MAMNSHFSEEVSEDIDIYGDLDDIEVRIQGTELITSSGDPAKMWLPQTKYGKSDAKDIETVVKIYEQAVSNELELYTELLAADYKKRRKKEEEELKHFKNTISENEDLRHKQKGLEDEMRLLKSENTVLRQNISSLYKTAKCEIDFKNALISELRTELDGYIFQRSEVPYNNRRRRQTTGKARRDKSYKDPEYESSTGKPSSSRRSSSLDVNPSIALIKQIYKDSSEKGEGSVNWRDIENVLKSAMHEFMNSEGKTSKLDESIQNGKNQECLIENLKKIMLSGKSNQSIGNTIQATKETSDFQSQKRHFTRKFPAKKYNKKTRNHSSFKKTCLSSSEKPSLLSPIQPCYVNERDTGPEQNFYSKNSTVLKLSHLCNETSRNFSNSMKKDAIKLFAYHNTDVPFAVKRKLGIPISKDGTRNAIELLQTLNLSSKHQRTPHKVPLSGERSITESMPLNVSSEISGNLQSNIRSASLSQITNLVTACTTVNSLTSCIITHSAISALVHCNRNLPIEMNPNSKTAHKRTSTKRNSSQVTHHEKEFHRSKGDIQQVSNPLEVSMFPKQNLEENAEMNALLDFGLQLFDDDSFEEIERSSPNAMCVTEVEQSDSSPKINFADGQFNPKRILLPTIDYTVTSGVASNKTTPCATSNAVTSCTVSNIVTPCVTSNTVATCITSSTMIPYVTASTMTTYVTSSTMTPCLISNVGTYNIFSDAMASSVACNATVPTVRTQKCKKVRKRNHAKKEKSLRVSLDPNKKFCVAKNNTEQVCVPTNELDLTLEQSSEADSQMNINAILDFGLQMFSDIPSKEMKRSSPNQVCATDSVQPSSFGSSVTCATTKSLTLCACDDAITPLTVNNDSPGVIDPHPKKARRRTSMKKKKSSQTPALHKREFNLSESNIQCDMIKESDEPVKQSMEEKCDLNFILDFGLQMLDDPFEDIKRTSSDGMCNVEAHSLYPTDSSATSAVCSMTIPNIKDCKKMHKRADTKRMSSTCKSSAKRKGFRLTENRTENLCVPPKKSKVSLKQNEIENNKMDAIFDLGLKMLDDPFSEMF